MCPALRQCSSASGVPPRELRSASSVDQNRGSRPRKIVPGNSGFRYPLGSGIVLCFESCSRMRHILVAAAAEILISAHIAN